MLLNGFANLGKHWHKWTLAVGASAFMGLLIACGSEGGTDGPSTATDAGDASTSTSADKDGAADGSSTPPETDGGTLDDGSTPLPPPLEPLPTCACDVTVLCDQACACDIACMAPDGGPPAGVEAIPLDRAEVAVYFPSSATGQIDQTILKDDAFTGDGGVPKAYATLLGPAAHETLPSPPLMLAGDVDNDGRDDAILVMKNFLGIDSWDGTKLGVRAVRKWTDNPTTFDAAVGDLANDGTRRLVVSRLVDTLLTIEVLDIAKTGAAVVAATLTIPGVRHHAVTIGRERGNERNQLYVLIGTASQFPIPIGSSNLTVQRFTLSGGSLVAGASTDLGSECQITADPPIHGSAIAVANLNATPESEIAVATYCSDGKLHVFTYDETFGGPKHKRAASDGVSFERKVPNAAPSIGRGSRPFLAVGQSGANLAAAKPTVVLGVTDENLGGFVGVFDGATLALDRATKLGGTLNRAILTGMAVRDASRDGIPEIFATGLAVSQSENKVTGYLAEKLGNDVEDSKSRVTLSSATYAAPSTDLSGGGPAIAAGDFDADSIRVRKTGKIYQHLSTPFVNALLSAPPTWLGKSGVTQVDGSTSFGTNASTGSSDTRTINASASLAVSASGDFGVYEVSASVKASVDYAMSSSTTNTISYGKETVIGTTDDVVLFRVVPYASHEYEVVSHPIPSQRGAKITFDVPGTMIETTASIKEFRSYYGAVADTIVPPGLLHHTVGDPLSYFAAGDCTKDRLATFVTLGKDSTVDEFYTTEARATGKSGSTVSSSSVGVSTQTGSSSSIDLNVEVSVSAGVKAYELEVSAGVGVGWTHETTIGKDVTYVGGVGDFISGESVDTRYQWSLCVFHYTNPRYGSYPVINYTVSRY